MSARPQPVGRVPPRGGRAKLKTAASAGAADNATRPAAVGRLPSTGDQGKERNDAALGHESQNTSNREGAKEGGGLPMGWRWSTFKDSTVNFDGRRVPIKEADRAKRSGPYPYYGASGVIDDIDDFLFDGEFLLVAEDGANLLSRSTPIAFRASGKFWVNNHAHVVQAGEYVSQGFIEYYLNSIDLKFYVSGSAQPKLTQANLNKIPVPLPPLPEQRRIVGEIEKQFTRLEAGVAALRRVQANLKRYRTAVLKAACEGHLVPTEAELVGRVPPRGVRSNATGNAASGDAAYSNAPFETGEALLARILTKRRQNWQGRGKYKEPVVPNTSNLPKMPDGWCWAGTEQVTAGIDNAITIGPFGSNLMVKDYLESGVSLIFVREIRSENFRRADTRYVSPKKAAELATHKVRGGDVVITKMGEPPGDTAIYPEDLPDAIATSDCIKLSPNLKGTTAAFLKYVIRGQPVKNQIERVTRGVAQKKMSLARFKTVAVPFPPLAEQTRIVAEVERRLSVVEELESVVSANLQRAVRLRQSILQKAFSGELM